MWDGKFPAELVEEKEDFWGQQVWHHQQYPISKHFLGTYRGQAPGQAAYLTDTRSSKHDKTQWSRCRFPHLYFMDADAEIQKD